MLVGVSRFASLCLLEGSPTESCVIPTPCHQLHQPLPIVLTSAWSPLQVLAVVCPGIKFHGVQLQALGCNWGLQPACWKASLRRTHAAQSLSPST
jgi:hypothetical protein